MFRTILLKDGSEWACESTRLGVVGYGVFLRRPDGTWQQQTGTGQTPAFRTAQQFSRFVHKHYRNSDGSPLPRMVASDYW